MRLVDDGKSYLFLCEPAVKYKGDCPRCGKRGAYYSKGYADDRYVHDISMGRKQVDIRLRVPRYTCGKCNASFSYPFKSVLQNRQFTKRLYEEIQHRALRSPFKRIADEYGISVTTVAEILSEHGEGLMAGRKVIAPRVLGIDEKHIVHVKRGVLTDIESGILLEMTADNKTDTIKAVIEALDGYDTNIEIVTIDMCMPYVSVIQECLPHAKIVVDKFHVIQNLYRKIEKTRKGLFAQLKAETAKLPDGEDKTRRQELLTRMGKNVFLFKFGQKKLDEKKDRASLMAELCGEFPELNTLRLLKEGIERIYEADTRKEAEKRFDEWLRLLPEDMDGVFKPISALKKSMGSIWKVYIFNYFDEGCRFTNAATEGLNSLIGHLNFEGRGYSFDTLRLKSLFHKESQDKPRFVKSVKKAYNFSTPAPLPQSVMGKQMAFTQYSVPMPSITAVIEDKQVSGGGVRLDSLLEHIKDIL